MGWGLPAAWHWPPAVAPPVADGALISHRPARASNAAPAAGWVRRSRLVGATAAASTEEVLPSAANWNIGDDGLGGFVWTGSHTDVDDAIGSHDSGSTICSDNFDTFTPTYASDRAKALSWDFATPATVLTPTLAKVYFAIKLSASPGGTMVYTLKAQPIANGSDWGSAVSVGAVPTSWPTSGDDTTWLSYEFDVSSLSLDFGGSSSFGVAVWAETSGFGSPVNLQLTAAKCKYTD